MRIVLASAADIRKKSGSAVAPVLRPQGPCYRPTPTSYPGVKAFPKGTTFYLALNPTSSVDPNAWSLFKTTLLAAVDNANQYFGSQPATSLLGYTATDDGFDPPLYAFKVFDSPVEANAAAASDSGPKIVVPIYDSYTAPAGGKVQGGFTKIWYKPGETVNKAEIGINFEEIKVLKELAKQIDSRFPDILVTRTIVDSWLHGTIPHELFDHLALTQKHITFGVPADDDDSALLYSGERVRHMIGQVFVPPVSYCDMVHGWASR